MPKLVDLAATVVLLRHDLDDGTHHFDWLLLPLGSQPTSVEDSLLLSFRCPQPLPDPTTGAAPLSMLIERLEPHRVRYLTYEGEIDRGRGRVRQVASGIIVAGVLGDDDGSFAIRWFSPEEPAPWAMRGPGAAGPGVTGSGASGAVVRYELHRLGGERWRVTAQPGSIPYDAR